jgi:uncharacterized membrane protein
MNTYYAIIIYIIIIVFLVITKPEFMYDHENKQYKEFGMTKNKTLFSLPVLSITIAIVIVMLFRFLQSNEKSKIHGGKIKYKYIPVQMMQSMPNLFNSYTDTNSIQSTN